MNRISGAICEIHHMDMLASRDQWVNRIHPLVKLVLTILYISVVVSFHKYDVAGTAGMAVYPMALFILAELSFADSLKRLRLVLPLVCLVTLIMKGVFSVLASYLLIATTSVDRLCYALRLLRIPKAVVTQFMLTYRYITVLLEEVNRITQAYLLRAPHQKGIHFKAWGPLAGQLLLRSMDRANEVYDSMLLRGYQGDYAYLRERTAFQGKDLAYLLFWAAVIAALRRWPVVLAAGGLFF